MKVKKIAIACDHRGVDLKNRLIKTLTAKGYKMIDCGTDSTESCDYPDFGAKAALAVQQGKSDRGIAICHSGIGMSMIANKIKGVRAALCSSVEVAELSRKHNDANVLALAGGYVELKVAEEICLKWLTTDFEGGRHARRVKKISDYEGNRHPST